ncbi:MAG: hypothetical protein CSA79_01065 [Thiothrix nivea]|nr:MAG: hypothetical protein CSA79_01065 [Thiothrix nivea]
MNTDNYLADLEEYMLQEQLKKQKQTAQQQSRSPDKNRTLTIEIIHRQSGVGGLLIRAGLAGLGLFSL